LIWILGHEIGHAVLHKQYVLSRGPLHFNLEYNELEKQADLFVAEKLSRNEPLASQFWTTTGEFIQHEYRRLYPLSASNVDPNDSEFVINHPLVVTYNKYNIPIILRAVRIVNRLLDVNTNIDSTEYYPAVEANITVKEDLAVGIPVWIGVAATAALALICIVFFFWHGRRPPGTKGSK